MSPGGPPAVPTRDAEAWSNDGAAFEYRSPIDRGLVLGDHVTVAVEDEQRLGQLLSQRSADHDGWHVVEGTGRLLTSGRTPRGFGRSAMTKAPPELVRQLHDRGAAGLEIGTLRTEPDLPAVLDAKGFNRHTFLCGQSGSGKTYALGGLLEQLLLRTRLPLLVLDPNGDHVHLGHTHPDVDPELAARYATAAGDVRVLQTGTHGEVDPLRIRLAELGASGAAALLQLDPIRDRQEYNALLHGLARAGEGFTSIAAALESFRTSGDEVLELIRVRAENLGIDRMDAWAMTSTPTVSDVWTHDAPRALIADTSGFDRRRDRIAIAVAVLEQLWADRKRRRPLLLVVDEAHDVCPADPDDPLQRLAVELFTRVAGEGRKYGIHLLLASQRPEKLPDNVVSQCDNLLLMRVNSAGDRAAMATLFGFVPPELVDLAASFELGETLVAGKISPHPQLARTGARLTLEGGADVPTDWVG